jgi:leucyl/phenylalanyl-tRNA--protein transferase
MAVLDPDLLLRAYSVGVFPMADSRRAPGVYWVEPKKRGILPLEAFRMSRSLAKTTRSERFVVTTDTAFAAVVAGCAEPTEARQDTWINPQIEHAYGELHRRGHAHSVEVWENSALVGGLYGVKLGRAFFGESMFSRRRDASKVAMAHLVARLRVGGFSLLDCQFITEHLASLGAIEIERETYVSLLDAALGVSADGAAGVGAAVGDFGALERREGLAPPAAPADAGAVSVRGPISGCRIVQLLGQTS